MADVNRVYDFEVARTRLINLGSKARLLIQLPSAIHGKVQMILFQIQRNGTAVLRFTKHLKMAAKL
jgi:hypothetical protein